MMLRRRYLAALLAATPALAQTVATPASPSSSDVAEKLNLRFANGIVAVAEEKIITVADVMQYIGPLMQQVREQSKSQQEFEQQLEQLQDSAIQDLIDRVLIVKEFRKDEKRNIPPHYVDNAIADEIAERFEGDAERVVRVRVVRPHGEREFDRRHGVLVGAAGGEGEAEVVVPARVGRAAGDELAEHVHRLARAAGPVQGVAEQVVGVGEFGIEPERPLEAVDGRGPVAGVGHGGVEAIVLGIQTLFGVIAFFYMRDLLPPEMAAIDPQPAYFLIGAASRLLIMVGHVGFTFLIWRAVSRGEAWAYPLAIVIHIAVDLVAFAQPIVLPGADWLGYVAVIGLAVGSLWLILRSRPVRNGAVAAV